MYRRSHRRSWIQEMFFLALGVFIFSVALSPMSNFDKVLLGTFASFLAVFLAYLIIQWDEEDKKHKDAYTRTAEELSAYD